MDAPGNGLLVLINGGLVMLDRTSFYIERVGQRVEDGVQNAVGPSRPQF